METKKTTGAARAIWMVLKIAALGAVVWIFSHVPLRPH